MINLNNKLEQFTRCYNSGPDPINPAAAATIQGQVMRRQLPRFIDTVASKLPALAQGEYNASAQVSPQYAALEQALKQDYGISGADLDAAIADRNVSNTSNILAGSGRDLVREATETARVADPEFFRLREIVGKGAADLVGGQDPNKLTESELENASRGVLRTNLGSGNFNTPSQTNTISNAMTFGDELTKKRQAFSQALGTATGSMPALRSGVDTFQMVTGKPAASGLGETRFATPQKQDSGNAFGAGNSVLGAGVSNVGSFNENQDMRGGFERVVGSLPDY